MMACPRRSWISLPRMRRKRRAWSPAHNVPEMQGPMRPPRGRIAIKAVGLCDDHHDPFPEPLFRWRAGNLCARIDRNGMHDALWRFSATAGAYTPSADSLLALRTD